MNVWQFNRALARRLTAWNAINMVFGVLIMRRGAFWRGFGSQNVGWAIINLAIAFSGAWITRRRYHRLPDPQSANVQAREARSLRRILWVNTFLDILYVLGGYRTAQTKGADNAFWRGLGWGIVFQGGLLFVFDLVHALLVPDGRR